MRKPGGNLTTLGKTYEVRGNGAEGSQWRDKPLYGWITHLPAGWVFTPAPETQYMPDGRFYSDFVDAFPLWTGGLGGTWSDEVYGGTERAASWDQAQADPNGGAGDNPSLRCGQDSPSFPLCSIHSPCPAMAR